jgi:rare lipoprotein A
LRVKVRNAASLLLAFACLSILAGCGSNKPQDGPPKSGSNSIPDLPGDAVPKPEPRSRYGNGPNYEVFGVGYTVMPSADGYKERGVASWYGKKFHGRLTSNREVYDMYLMTAAHKTLPLPTYVRVRNLSNNKSIVVRVNDRGPFVDNRIIDLSYSAAMKLDLIASGTGLVEVEAITFGAPSGARTTAQTSVAPAAVAPAPAAAPTTPAASSGSSAETVYAQIGAFGNRENAERRLAVLRDGGLAAAFILEDTSASPTLYRVRMGPINDVAQYDMLVEELHKLGISDPILVTD